MGIARLRVLAASLGFGAAIGATAGAMWALFSDREVLYGIATGLFLVGVVALAVGLLGATEPPEGWTTRRRSRRDAEDGRRSLASRLAGDVGTVEGITALGLVLWALVVGGGLLGLSLLLFAAVSS